MKRALLILFAICALVLGFWITNRSSEPSEEISPPPITEEVATNPFDDSSEDEAAAEELRMKQEMISKLPPFAALMMMEGEASNFGFTDEESDALELRMEALGELDEEQQKDLRESFQFAIQTDPLIQIEAKAFGESLKNGELSATSFGDIVRSAGTLESLDQILVSTQTGDSTQLNTHTHSLVSNLLQAATEQMNSPEPSPPAPQ